MLATRRYMTLAMLYAVLAALLLPPGTRVREASATWSPGRVDAPAQLVVTARRLRYAPSPVTGSAIWACTVLTEDCLRGNATRIGFHVDPHLPANRRANDEDYAGEPYDIGHLIPKRYFADQDDANATFTYGQAVPFDKPLNRGEWSRLEAYVFAKIARGREVWDVTIPIYDYPPGVRPKTIGPHNLPVPTHLIKVCRVVERGRNVSIEAWLAPNEPPRAKKFSDFRVPMATVRALSCIDVFPLLDDAREDRLEKASR